MEEKEITRSKAKKVLNDIEELNEGFQHIISSEDWEKWQRYCEGIEKTISKYL